MDHFTYSTLLRGDEDAMGGSMVWVHDSVGVAISVDPNSKPRTSLSSPGDLSFLYVHQPPPGSISSTLLAAGKVGGGQQTFTHRQYSEQDIITRSARASLPATQKHRSAASYPIYSPTSYRRELHSHPAESLSRGSSQAMESPQFRTRTSSLSSMASSISLRGSSESRYKSSLSNPSSMEEISSMSSTDSIYPIQPSSQHLNTVVSYPMRKTSIEPTVQVYNTEQKGRKLQRKTLPKLGTRPPRQRIKRSTMVIPGDCFRRLPEEILGVVLVELRKLHLKVGSTSCPTCCMRDFMSLGLSCKKWWGSVKVALYENIQIVGIDSILHTKKKYKVKHGTRLTLLRRTLRTCPDLASYVKFLKVPAIPETAKTPKEIEQYIDLVASLVMVCPNLQKLCGFNQKYNHDFSRLVHALSTRKKLTEMVWLINASPFQRQHRYQFTQDSDYFAPVLAVSPLLPEQCEAFMAHHTNWSNLQSLVLHCNLGGNLDAALFPNLLWSLPNVENLHVSSFPAPSFNDKTLLSLPSLKKIRLENLPGITAAGLSAYPSPRRTDNMTSMSLISMPLLSLQVLARMFGHLKSLTRFTISQAPSLSPPDDTEIFLHPYLASNTLEFLHWEFTNPGNDRATMIMASAIIYGGFPALRTIRAPADHDGTMQKLCRPRRHIELPGDRYRNISFTSQLHFPHTKSLSALPQSSKSPFPTGHNSTYSLTNPLKDLQVNTYASTDILSPTRSAFSLTLSSPASSQSSTSSPAETRTSLSLSRKVAQHRIDTSFSSPKFHIIIWSPSGEFLERFAVGAFIGTVGSRIDYTLRPDIEGSDDAIVGVEGRLGVCDDKAEMARDGCTGLWNAYVGTQVKGSARGKETWWHTERGRWREVEVGRLF